MIVHVWTASYLVGAAGSLGRTINVTSEKKQ